MSIPNPRPLAHPSQPGVTLDRLAVEGLVLTGGGSIDGPARLAVSLRPFAAVRTAGGADAYLTAADAPPHAFVIADVYAWVRDRAAAGDALPAQVMGLLVRAVGEEYARRAAG